MRRSEGDLVYDSDAGQLYAYTGDEYVPVSQSPETFSGPLSWSWNPTGPWSRTATTSTSTYGAFPHNFTSAQRSIEYQYEDVERAAMSGHRVAQEADGTWRCLTCNAATRKQSILNEIPCSDGKVYTAPTDPTFDQSIPPTQVRIGDTWANPWHGTMTAIDDEKGPCWVSSNFRVAMDRTTDVRDTNPLCERLNSRLLVPDLYSDDPASMRQYTDFLLYDVMVKEVEKHIKDHRRLRVTKFRFNIDTKREAHVVRLDIDTIIRPDPEEE